MKVVQINATCGAGSTGKICVAIGKLLEETGIENYILFSSGDNTYPLGIRYAQKGYIMIQALKSHLFGNYGFNSHISTYKLIAELDSIKPNIVHIHNIHGHDCNLGMLFHYLNRHKEISVIWTFHDCWAFTGYCPYFDFINCGKWKSGCGQCQISRQYSWLADRSRKNYLIKKHSITQIASSRLSLVTPSQWLAELIKESFLKKYPVEIINNGVDLDVFKPRMSHFKEKYGLATKKIVLGVAAGFKGRKGLDCIIDLSKRLSEGYIIVLVGVKKEDLAAIPESIITIRHTSDQYELAEIYSAAEVFINPTFEDNFPTTNIESLACGTPVITYRTGGSPEIIDSSCGICVEKGDTEGMKIAIYSISKEKYTYACRERAERLYDQNEVYKKYLDLYRRSLE